MNDDLMLIGIVILTKVYKENDALITIISESGKKMTFKGQGIMRITSKNSPACQMFTKGEYNFVDKAGNYKVLKTAKIIHTPKNYFSRYQASISAMVICELIDKITYDNRINSNLYRILENAIFTLETAENSLNVLIIAIFELLREDGYDFVKDGCCNCGKKKNIVSINLALGGFLCASCSGDANNYSVEFLRGFRYLLKAKMENADTFLLDPDYYTIILHMLFDYLEYSCGLVIKTAQYLL